MNKLFDILIVLISFSLFFVNGNGNIEEIDKRTCLFKSLGEFPENVFSYHASWTCYNGFAESIYKDGRINESDCAILHENSSYSVPGIQFNELCLAFDWKDSVIQNKVRSSFRNEMIFEKWEKCSQSAINCCNEMLNIYNKKEEYGCPAVWDGWTCFEPADFNKKIRKVCPSYSFYDKEPNCEFHSWKKCSSRMMWEETDYSHCSSTYRMLPSRHWHIIITIISISICVPTLLLMTSNKSLRSSKLFAILFVICSIMVRDILYLLSKTIVIADDSRRTIDGQIDFVSCQLLPSLIHLADNFVLTFLLWLAIFLYRKVCAPNSIRFVMTRAVIIGIIISFGSTIAWGLCMFLSEPKDCWIHDRSNYKWIIFSTQILLILTTVHVLFRILCSTFNSSGIQSEETVVLRKSAKTTIFCIPIFLVPLLIRAVVIEPDSCAWDEFYYFIFYTLLGLQGILFSTICFYDDSDVKNILLKILFAAATKCKICSKTARERLNKQNEPTSPELPLDTQKRFSIVFNNPFGRKSIPNNNPACTVQRGEVYSWDDIVEKARNSISEPNDVIPTQMRPYRKRSSIKDIVMKATVALKKDVPVCEPVKYISSPVEPEKRRNTIKEMVLKTARGSISNDNHPESRRKSSAVSKFESPKPTTPPLPKSIPDEILDDIQLFDYYYNNLDNILISEDKNEDVDNTSNNSSLTDLSEFHKEKLKRHASLDIRSPDKDEKIKVKRMLSSDSASNNRIVSIDEGTPSNDSMDSIA